MIVDDSLKSEAARQPGRGFAYSAAALFSLLVLLAIAWFGTLDQRKLVKSDEGRYAEISREMAQSGDWITPRYNDVKYFEKPPLLYWASAAAFKVFGETEWAARLWVALTGFAGVLIAYFAGCALFGATAGLLGAIVLASSPLWVLASHFNTTDMGVSFFIEAALLAFLAAQRAGTSERKVRFLMLACWAAMGFAVLSKGLIGIVLPGLVLACYVTITRDFRPIGRLHLGKGLLLFLIIVVPWFLAVSLRNPEFPRFFFIHEHFGRFTQVEGYNRYGPWWYFLAIIAVGMLPWIFIVPRGLAEGLSFRGRDSASEVEPRLFLLLWIVVITVFFSVSRSKLPGYIVPVVPALSLLVGLALSRMSMEGFRWFLVCTAVLATATLVVMIVDPGMLSMDSPSIRQYSTWVIGGVSLVTLASIALLILLSRSEWLSLPLIATIFAGFVHIATQAILLGHETLRSAYSSYDLAMSVNRHIDRSQPFYSVRTFDHTLPFYMKKTMILVDHEDELAFGLSIEPERGVRSMDEFRRRWEHDRSPLALIEKRHFEELRLAGLAMRVMAEDGKRLVVGKPNGIRRAETP